MPTFTPEQAEILRTINRTANENTPSLLRSQFGVDNETAIKVMFIVSRHHVRIALDLGLAQDAILIAVASDPSELNAALEELS